MPRRFAPRNDVEIITSLIEKTDAAEKIECRADNERFSFKSSRGTAGILCVFTKFPGEEWGEKIRYSAGKMFWMLRPDKKGAGRE